MAPTLLNPESSRSHAVLIIKTTVRLVIDLFFFLFTSLPLLSLFCQKKDDAQVVYNGKLHLIDLAGSEDNRRTGNTGISLLFSNLLSSSKKKTSHKTLSSFFRQEIDRK